MNNLHKRIISCFSAVLIAAAAFGSFVTAHAESTPSQSIQQGNVLHCFVWKFSDIRAELPRIAEAGFTAVQTSPVQFTLDYGTYDAYYRPVSFALNSYSEFGDMDELKALCEEAEKYGIKVIVDVVANHMGSFREAAKSDESFAKWLHYLSEAGYFDTKYLKDEYWHNRGIIRNYNKRSDVTNGDMHRYLPDLNTENHEVQADAKELLAKLKALGVDGVRWDGAKHIALPSEGSDFWPNVIDTEMYHYGEILGGPTGDKSSDPLMKEYTDYMSVTDSAYGALVLENFNNGKAPDNSGNWIKRGVSADKLMYWAETHDTYCGGNSYSMSQNTIDRAYAVVGSRQGASALYFSRPNDKIAPAGEKGSTHFTSPEVAAVNRFRTLMADRAEYVTAENNCTVVTRQNGGAVLALGNGSGDVSVPNGNHYVPQGQYIDEVSGNTFTVTADVISGTVGDSGIAVLYRRTEQPSKETETTVAPATIPAASSAATQPSTAETATVPKSSSSSDSAPHTNSTPDSVPNGENQSTGTAASTTGGAIATDGTGITALWIVTALSAAVFAIFFIRRNNES